MQVQDHREDWPLQVTQPVTTGNYYPVIKFWILIVGNVSEVWKVKKQNYIMASTTRKSIKRT